MERQTVGNGHRIRTAPAVATRVLAGLTLVSLLLATSARSQTTASTSNAGDPSAASMKPNQQAGPVTGPNLATPTLQPGDVVRLKIWREPDLSGDFNVDDRGIAVFPKIGPVHVSEMSPDSLRKMLVTTYSTYLRDPAIEITMMRRVNVLGAVARPGLYPIDATMTVSDVLAQAGGATANGNQKSLELIRDGKRVPMDFSMRTPVSETPIRSGDQLYLPERSWLSRNGYVVGVMIATSVAVGIAVISRK